MTIDWRKYPDGGIYAYVSEPEAVSLDICCGLNGFWTARAFQAGLKVHKDGGYTSKYRARIALQKWLITKHVETI